jgi:hypothetical protein
MRQQRTSVVAKLRHGEHVGVEWAAPADEALPMNMLTQPCSPLPTGCLMRTVRALSKGPGLGVILALVSCGNAPTSSADAPGGHAEPRPVLVRTEAPPPPGAHKRLMHFQSVAFSTASKTAPGRVSPHVCSPSAGWSAHVDNALGPLVRRLGPGTFDWWGHRTGGSWTVSGIALDTRTTTETEFEALDLARQRFPQLVNFAPLVEFARANGIELYGYVGFPRCDKGPRFQFAAVPGHSDRTQMDRWYGEFVRSGFKGIGHDWSQYLPPESGVLTVNFPYLRNHGIEPFIEAMPERKDSHLLGWSVVLTETRLRHTERKPDKFFTVDEIRQAGGRVVIIFAHPPQNFEGDVWRWRFDRAVARLKEGETVAVNLKGLAEHGLPIEQLVEFSRKPPAGQDSEADQPDPE